MLRQQLKNVYFGAIRWATLPNYFIQQAKYSQPRAGMGLYVHLGSGVDYREGFINVEGNLLRHKDMWLDVRNGLPFPDNSVRFVYSCHMLEHLYPDEAIKLLEEVHRILSPTGVARIAVPGFEHALEIAAGTATTAFPRAFDDCSAQAINYLFCDGQHKYAYSFPLFESFARTAGFTSVTEFSAIRGVATETYGVARVGGEPEGSLVVELRKRCRDQSGGGQGLGEAE